MAQERLGIEFERLGSNMWAAHVAENAITPIAENAIGDSAASQ